jgi:hypothetical protein
MPMLLAAVESAKLELRQEFDNDILTLGAALFGTTDKDGRLLKPGITHMFSALDNTIAFLCDKAGVTPKDVNDWVQEQAKKASQEPENKVKLT